MTGPSYHSSGSGTTGSHDRRGSSSSYTDHSFAAAHHPATGAANRSAHPASHPAGHPASHPANHSANHPSVHAINHPSSRPAVVANQSHAGSLRHDQTGHLQPGANPLPALDSPSAAQLSNIDQGVGDRHFAPLHDFGLATEYVPKDEPDWYDDRTSMPTAATQNRPRSSSYSGPYARRRSAEEAPHRRTTEESTQRRRENHNAVERRRRDVINEKIKDLDALLPVSFVEEVGGSTSDIHHKPNVLRRSVAYIRQLHLEREQMLQHQRELERRVEQLEDLLGE